MRKTRLVILPTKCLHQMGFLLLFLSCPVIGDWGRIRPESENSHNAIQIDREGTCGFERDPPGGLMDFLNENGFQQCQISEDLDSSTTENKPVESILSRKYLDRGDEARRVIRQRTMRMSERRMINERDVRKAIQRRTSERRDVTRVHQRDYVRSRSVEPTRSSYRNEGRIRSLSLSRLETDRKSQNIRQGNEKNLKRKGERLLLSRRMSERQNERRVEQQRRNTRGQSNERRENERIQTPAERTERRIVRILQSAESERQNARREINRRSIQEQSMRREKDMMRRQNVRGRAERRPSLARREENNEVRLDRIEKRRSADQITSERRTPEIRKTRNLEFDGVKSARMIRSVDIRRETDSRRFVRVSSKMSERNVRERSFNLVDPTYERVERVKSRRLILTTAPRNQRDTLEVNLSISGKAEDDNLFEGVTKWTDMKANENYKIGDWTTNCIIGTVIYYFTTRQIKSV